VPGRCCERRQRVVRESTFRYILGMNCSKIELFGRNKFIQTAGRRLCCTVERVNLKVVKVDLASISLSSVILLTHRTHLPELHSSHQLPQIQKANRALFFVIT